ncbi:hypothetical protein K2Z84_03100 [Candidatus Binatia bacterium]|nr:hypothetical protein [Candidatus Binatia bacterium]
MPSGGHQRAFAAGLLAALLVLVFTAYRSALDAWFATDDFLWLDLSHTSSVLASFVGPWGHGAAYRPLPRVSFWIDALLFGRAASPWHAHSLALHALGSTMLGILVHRLSGERALAILSAVIFALLPLSYEATIWISGRMYVQCVPLALTSALLFDRWLLRPGGGRLLPFVLALALTFATYEGSVYVVAIIALVALIRVCDGERPPRAIVGLALTVVLAIAYLLLRRRFVGPGDFLPTRPVLALAFLDDLRAVGSLFLSQVTPALWPFALTAVAAAVFAPRMLAIAGLGVVLAAAAYAPFSFVSSFGMRYLYAAGLGLSITLAALVVGMARVPRIGLPVAALLFVLLLRGEWTGVTAAARDWAEAGALAQRTLADVARVVPPAPRDEAVAVFDVPLQHGRAMTFFTYFDVAMRLFHPEVPRLVLPMHYLVELDEDAGWMSIATTWDREAARRATAHLAPLACQSAAPLRSRDRVAVARALLACDTTFVALAGPQGARPIGRAEALDRLKRKLGPAIDAEPGPTPVRRRETPG